MVPPLVVVVVVVVMVATEIVVDIVSSNSGVLTSLRLARALRLTRLLKMARLMKLSRLQRKLAREAVNWSKVRCQGWLESPGCVGCGAWRVSFFRVCVDFEC